MHAVDRGPVPRDPLLHHFAAVLVAERVVFYDVVAIDGRDDRDKQEQDEERHGFTTLNDTTQTQQFRSHDPGPLIDSHKLRNASRNA